VSVAASGAQPAAEAPLFEVRTIGGGQGLFAQRTITAGAHLFGEDVWADDEERKRFASLSAAQVRDLTPSMRELFLRFAYNSSQERISGTFHPEAVRHPVNFINHSCDPNAGYDGADHIVALTGIAPGEQIRMDYGTYSFSFDHAFACRCGAPRCRGRVTQRDWPDLVRAGLRLPSFMRKEASKVLWG
jgi:SET domain-containing protein